MQLLSIIVSRGGGRRGHGPDAGLKFFYARALHRHCLAPYPFRPEYCSITELGLTNFLGPATDYFHDEKCASITVVDRTVHTTLIDYCFHDGTCASTTVRR
jgi:hypothetical protein